MTTQNKPKNVILKLLPLILVGALLIGVGVSACIRGFDVEKRPGLKYSDNNSAIEYSVCYTKDSPLVEEQECVNKEAYITKFIDRINFDLHYKSTFSAPVTGTLQYQLVAVVRAVSDSGSSRDELVSNTTILKNGTKPLNDVKDLIIDFENMNVSYTDADKFITDLRRTLTSAAGELEIALSIDGKFSAEGTENIVFPKKTIPFLRIPVGVQTADVRVENPPIDITDIMLTEDVNTDDEVKSVMRICGFALIAGGLLCFIFSILRRKKLRLGSDYNIEIDRILSTYDSIIVSVKSMPDTSKLSINEVQDFDELLDAYEAVKLPINFYQSSDMSVFLLISDNIAWIYTLYSKKIEQK